MTPSTSLQAARTAFLSEVAQSLSQQLQEQGASPRVEGLAIFEHEQLTIYALPADFSPLPSDRHGSFVCMQFSLVLKDGQGEQGDFAVRFEVHGDHAHAHVCNLAGEVAKQFRPQVSVESVVKLDQSQLEVTNLMAIPKPDGGRILILNALLGFQGRTYQLGIMLN